MHNAPNLSGVSGHRWPVRLSRYTASLHSYKNGVVRVGLFNSCANYRGKQGCTFSQPPYNSLVSLLFVFPDRGCVGGLFSEPTTYRSPLCPLTSPHSLAESVWPEGGGVEGKHGPHPERININTWRGSNLHNLFALPFIVGGLNRNRPTALGLQHSSQQHFT